MMQTLTLPGGAAVIIPVHNRKVKTLACLDRLERNGDLARCSVIVVDDGSTDGTSEAIRARFPSATILSGDGNLWWTGAMVLGMRHAVRSGAELIIWLNDDTCPEPGAISRLVAAVAADRSLIAGAQSYDPTTGAPSYGGIVKTRRRRLVQVSAAPGGERAVDGLNGNLVCFSVDLVAAIGYPDASRHPHNHADYVYTYAAKRAGFRPTILGDAVAWCENDHDPGLIGTGRTALELLKDRFQVRSPYYWRSDSAYYRDMFGPSGSMLYVLDRIVGFSVQLALVALLPRRARLALKPAIEALRRRIRPGRAIWTPGEHPRAGPRPPVIETRPAS